MADNITTKDASDATQTVATSDDGTAHSPRVVSHTTQVNVSLTRPADTSAYVAGDAITTATSSASGYTFSNCARVNAGTGTIVDAQLILSDPNATLCNFQLFLFSTAPAITNDNAAFAPSDTEIIELECVLNFNTGDYAETSNNRVYHMTNPPRFFKCASGSKTLTGILVTRTGFTPTSASTFRVKLDIVQDA